MDTGPRENNPTFHKALCKDESGFFIEWLKYCIDLPNQVYDYKFEDLNWILKNDFKSCQVGWIKVLYDEYMEEYEFDDPETTAILIHLA